jgi:hypothetical protein
MGGGGGGKRFFLFLFFIFLICILFSYDSPRGLRNKCLATAVAAQGRVHEDAEVMKMILTEVTWIFLRS